MSTKAPHLPDGMLALARNAATFAIFFGLYLSQASSVNAEELAIGAVGGFAVTLLLIRLRAEAQVKFTARLAWLALLSVRIPLQALRDSVVVLGTIFRRATRGRVCAVHFHNRSEERNGPAAVHRALAITGVSVAPNTVVIDVDHDRERLLIHQLVATPEPPGRGDRQWPL